MNWAVKFVLMLAVAGVAAVVYVLLTNPSAQRSVTAGVASFRESLLGGDPAPYVDPVSDTAGAPAAAAGRRADPPPPGAESRPPEAGVPPGAPAGETGRTMPSPDVPEAPRVDEIPTEGTAPARRPVAHYLPGSLSAWTDFGIEVDTPVALLAGGVISTEIDFSGPDGLVTSNFERTVGRSRPERHARVLDSAPYLALIGRVCSDARCSDPFIVGSNTVICPADIAMGGALQLWTNNYVRVDGAQTRGTYSTTTGGFSFYTEPAPPSDCGGRSAAPGVDAAVLASGRELNRPEFRISSSQTFWKPFFLPLEQPLAIRATGQINPSARARDVGPDGTVVPDEAEGLVLLVPALPYAALMGRLCGADTCGQPFLVGAEHVVCPTSTETRHLELWINHLAPTPSLLDRAMPITFEMFELQTRSGEFRFTVAAASPAACGSRPAFD